MNESILAILFAGIGFLALSASIGNWNWYFETQNAAFFVKHLHRNGARILYGITGILLLVAALLLLDRSLELGLWERIGGNE